MKTSNMHKIRKLLAVLLLLLFLFANIYSIRRIMHYAQELYFYDKMFVAYQVAGEAGVKKELEAIISQEKAPREIALAKVFKEKLNNMPQLDSSLKDTTETLKRNIRLFRNLRNSAFGLIMVVLLSQLFINLRLRRNT